MGEKIRVLIVDDHALFRSGIKSLLQRHQEFEVVDVAAGRGDDVVDAGGRVAGDAWSSLDAQATAPSATSSAAPAADARTDDRDPAMAHPRWRRYRGRSVRARRPVSCRP